MEYNKKLSTLFHETKEIKMFKKSLLALSVAGTAAFTANAGILTASITETAALSALVTAETTCADAAAVLGLTVSNTGTNTFEDNTGTADTINVVDGGSAGVYDTAANTAVWTADDVCTITVNSDLLVAASSVSNSLEGAQANGVTISANLIAGVGGYTDEDTVRIQVAGGIIDEDASAGATLTGGTTSAFTLLGVVGNEVLFTVDNGAQDAREIVALAGLVVTPNDGVEELSLEAQTQNTANVVYDTSDSELVTVLEAQYTGAVDSAWDGIIDVATERLVFEANADDSSGAAEAVTDDSVVFEVTENTTQGNLDPDSVTIAVSGDFSWMAQLDTSDDGEDITSAELATGLTYLSDDTDNTFASAGNDAVDTIALNDDMDTLTITLDTTDGDVDPFHKVTFNVPAAATGEESLNVQSFTVSIVANDSAAASGAGYDATIAAAGTAAGEWTLNGSVVTVPYMPFGPNTKVIMRHTNTGVQEGDVTVRYMLEGVSDNWESVGAVATSSRGVMDIRDAVIDAIMADAGVEQGKVAIEITTNVPSEDVTVYAGYNVKNSADDRGFVGTFGEHGSAK
jgi:hypothetical protein